MARFIVLKGQSNYAVFDFDGNIARVGSGANVDLRLEGDDSGDDLFFLTKSDKGGYQLESRSSSVKVFVNGTQVAGTVRLEEGAKISILDYLILVNYQGADQAQPVEPKEAAPPESGASTSPVTPSPQAPAKSDRPTPPQSSGEPPPVGDDKTALVVESTPPAVEPETPRSNRTPPPLSSTDQETVRISFEEQALPVMPQKQVPAAEEVAGKIEPVYSLVCLAGQQKGKVFRIDSEEYVVGRDRESNLIIDHDEKGRPDTSVSRRHFVLSSVDDGLYITDKVSRLRTYINGKVLEPGQREQIAPEDLISIPSPQGEIKFRLCFVDEENFAPVEARKTTLWMALGLVIVIVILILAWVFLL